MMAQMERSIADTAMPKSLATSKNLTTKDGWMLRPFKETPLTSLLAHDAGAKFLKLRGW